MPRSESTKKLDRDIARLAIPALGALVAEPLYVLADTAVVGKLLGTASLAGLGLAGQTLLTVFAFMNFLAYGTTAAVSRLLGAGKHRQAAHQAVQGLWLAFSLGVGLALTIWFAADPILNVLGDSDAAEASQVLPLARRYLVVSLWGLPAMLLMLSGVGYLRGLQDTKRPFLVALVTAAFNLVLELILIAGFNFEIGASALSTVVSQWLGAAAYLWWIGRDVLERNVSLVPDFSEIFRLLKVGSDLVIRTVALRGSFTVTVAVAGRISTEALAAHEIVFQLFVFTALGLDAVAIAGQAMMGTYLGAGDVAGARNTAKRIVFWGVASGFAFMAVLGLATPFLPGAFSSDEAVISLAIVALIHLALIQPLNGLVFALDGILIGAGDIRFLAYAMAGAATIYVPLALLIPAFGLGLGWLWASLWVLMSLRAASLGLRYKSDAWLTTGAA